MKKLRSEIRIMKMAFLAIALLMAVIFGFVMAIAESIGATVMTVTVLILIMTTAFLSLAASGVLPCGSEEDSSDDNH